MQTIKQNIQYGRKKYSLEQCSSGEQDLSLAQFLYGGEFVFRIFLYGVVYFG